MNNVIIFHLKKKSTKAMFGLRVLCPCLGAKRVSTFFFFFFLLSAVKADFFNHEQCIRVLFTDPQISLFINFFIKNMSHDTIYTFKNYFATVFFSFQFLAVSKRTLNGALQLIHPLTNHN